MRKLKRIKKVKCCYCSHFFKPIEMTKENRKCRPANKKIKSDSESCEHFQPHPFFWCEEEGCFMALAACINRRQLLNHFKKIACHDCGKQQEEIDEVFRLMENQEEVSVEVIKPKKRRKLRRIKK